MTKTNRIQKPIIIMILTILMVLGGFITRGSNDYSNGVGKEPQIIGDSRVADTQIFRADFEEGISPNPISGWTNNNNPGSYMFFRYADQGTTMALQVSDNQGSSIIYGYTTFGSTTQNGVLTFQHKVMSGGAGAVPREYHVILEDAAYNDIITLKLLHYYTSNYYTLGLQGTQGTTSLTQGTWHTVSVTFKDNLLNLTVDGTPELTNIAYSGVAVAGIRIDSTVGTSGGDYYYDNITITDQSILTSPSAPVLVPIDSNPDYNNQVYLRWNAVSGATSYTVYRDTTQITDVNGLTPIGNPTEPIFIDSGIVANNTYWYAIVATNAGGNSTPSNSECTTVVLNDQEVKFWEDFDDGTSPNPITGWTNNNDPASFMFFRYADQGTARALQVSDNQASSITYGNTSFGSTTQNGVLSFRHKVMSGGAGAVPREYHVILEDAAYNDVITIKLLHYYTSNYYTLGLQGTQGTTAFTQGTWHNVSVTFKDYFLNLTVDGTPELTNIAYSGVAVAGIRIDSTIGTSGGDYYYDNILVRTTGISTIIPPSAPVLAAIVSNPDYDDQVYLRWNAVSGATSYKVYRDITQITDVSGLTPIGYPTVPVFINTGIIANDTYWYAIVATNVAGDSVVSNSECTTVVLNDQDVMLWADFDEGTSPNPITGWTNNNNPASFMFFRYADQGTTMALQVSDNQASSIIYGYTTLNSAITNGVLTFQHKVMSGGGGAVPREYHVILEDAAYNDIITLKLLHYYTSDYYTLGLQGTQGTTAFTQGTWHNVSVTFKNNLLNLTVDGTPELTNIAYSGVAVAGIRIDSTVGTSGGDYYYDNILVRTTGGSTIVPSAPVLEPIASNPDYDDQVYLRWNAVSGATSYEVYRDITQITDVSGLTPIGNITEPLFIDMGITSNDVYWYAIVATNAIGDSAVSNSECTTVVLNDHDVMFWEDFDDGTCPNPISGWTNNNNPASFMFFRYADQGTTMALQVSDNQASSIVYGNTSFGSTTQNGVLSFRHKVMSSGGGAVPREYHVILEDAAYNDVITLKLLHYYTSNYYTLGLQGTQGTTAFTQGTWHNVSVTFKDNLLSLTVDGTLELTNIAYSGVAVAGIRIESTVGTSGGDYYFDNLLVKATEYVNGIPFTLEPGAHQVTVKDSDHLSIIFECSITVLTTTQMVVSAFDDNPTITPLSNGVRYFTIEVLSGTYLPQIAAKFYYDDTGLSGLDESRLKVHTLSGSAWSSIGGLIYTAPNYLLINLEHFSSYAIVVTSTNDNPTQIPIEYVIGAILALLAAIGIYAVIKIRGKHGTSSGSPEIDYFDEFDP